MTTEWWILSKGFVLPSTHFWSFSKNTQSHKWQWHKIDVGGDDRAMAPSQGVLSEGWKRDEEGGFWLVDGVEVSVMACFINSCQCHPMHPSLILEGQSCVYHSRVVVLFGTGLVVPTSVSSSFFPFQWLMVLVLQFCEVSMGWFLFIIIVFVKRFDMWYISHCVFYHDCDVCILFMHSA